MHRVSTAAEAAGGRSRLVRVWTMVLGQMVPDPVRPQVTRTPGRLSQLPPLHTPFRRRAYSGELAGRPVQRAGEEPASPI